MHILIAIFFAAATAFLAWMSGRLAWTGMRNSLRTLGWKRTTGTVLRCELADGDPMVIVQARRARRLELAVEYVVSGVPYTTGQVSALGDPRDLYYAGRTLGRMRRRFASGAQVPVHYDPASPRDALLLRVEPGKLLLAGFFTVLFTAAAPLILWAGVTAMEPTRLRETKTIQALERQAPPVLSYLKAHPELGRAQHARGFSVGWPHYATDTALAGDWSYGIETTTGYYFVRAEKGRVVEATLWENPSGDPAWVRAVKRLVGM